MAVTYEDECGCTAITSSRGEKGDTGATGATGATGSSGAAGTNGTGTLVISGYNSATYTSEDIYNGGTGYTWGTGLTISGITAVTNKCLITTSLEVSSTDTFEFSATLVYNGTPSTQVFNIRRATVAASITGTSRHTLEFTGQLSNVANTDVITIKVLATSGATTPVLKSVYMAAQIFQ